MKKRSPQTVTLTMTLKEAMAVYQYLHWATQIDGGGLSCWSKQNHGEWQRSPTCALEQCDWMRPHGGAKTLIWSALRKLGHILLGEPVVTPCPDDIGETRDYPDALVNPDELEFNGAYVRPRNPYAKAPTRGEQRMLAAIERDRARRQGQPAGDGA